MFALLSYLGAHWGLFLAVVLATVGLSAAAWFLKNWKFAAAAIALTVFGLAYQSSNMDGYKRKVAEDAQEQVTVLKSRILSLSIAAAEDAKRAQADAFLNAHLDQLSRETPYNPGPCLDLDATRRLRAITGSPGTAKPTAVSPRRLTDLFQRRSKAP